MVSAAVLVVLLVMTLESASMASASQADVNIYNMLPDPIQMHCQSRDRDLKSMWLQGHAQFFGWGFTPSIWGRSLFFCSFRWGTKHQVFDVWSERYQECALFVAGEGRWVLAERGGNHLHQISPSVAFSVRLLALAALSASQSVQKGRD